MIERENPHLKLDIPRPFVSQTELQRKPASNEAAGLDNFPMTGLAEQNCISKINCSQRGAW
jgi:hypothetical protein